MVSRSRGFRPRSAHVAALLLVLGSMLMRPSTGAAQLGLGSLVVNMTSPASGSTIDGTVPVSASVTIIGALAVRGVQFTLNGVNLGAEDTTAPYSISWNTRTVANGTYTLTAIARDLVGLRLFTSDPITVTVFNDTTAPSVAITSPSAGATVSGATTIGATASDNVGVAGVQFRVDGANFGAEDTSAPYSMPWNTATAANGAHTITAVARDAAGNVATAAITVTVSNDGTPPSVAIAAPAPGAALRGTANVTANASDNVGVAGVQFRLDGANLGAEDTSAPYTVAWNTTTAGNGAHTLTAVARDAAGNVTTSSAVAVTVDNAAPTVAITAPVSGATVSGSVTVSANASDNGAIAGVQFRLDGANLGGEDTTSPYAVSWDTTTAADGAHTLTAVARDASGGTATSAAVTVTVSNVTETVTRIEDPSASIAYAGSWALGNTAKAWSGGTAALATGGPSATGEATRATLTFTGTGVRWIGFTGPQAGIARVYLDGALVATVDTYAPTEAVEAVLYTATGLASMTHTLAVESTGTRNAASSDIFVVVDAFDVTSAGGGADTTPPTVTITTPTGGSTANGTIIVGASASDAGGIAGVQFRLDGAALQAEDATAPYSINWDTTTVADGSHTLTAVARDAAGNTATSAAVAVTVSNGTAPPPGVMTRIENTDPSITYTPGSAATSPPNWWHGSRSRGWSNETSSFNRSEGARATFAFNGSAVTWIGFRAPWAGIARVYLDGAFAGEFDLYATVETPQAAAFSASGLASGPHTLIVESTGRKNPSASDNAVVVDAFDVGPATPPPVAGTRIENTSSAMTFTGGWAAAGASAAWSGGSAVSSATVGSRATVTFTGTSVSLIGLRGPRSGIARVYLDGSFHSTIDTYSPADIQAVVFTDTNLAPGRHEMIVEVTGLRNAAATDHGIVVDAFDARTRFEEVDPAVAYSGAWAAQNFDDSWSGTSANYGSGSATRTATAGSRAVFSFTGTSVSWIGYRGPVAGIARIYVDGAFVTDVDAYAAVKQVQATLFSANGLAAGPHTLTIEATGLKNAASGAALVIVDAFEVTLSSAPSVRRFQQTDATYPVGAWEQSSTNLLYTGGTIAFSDTTGARVEFTFTGSDVRWIGQRAFGGGIARVFLDGQFVADIDTYSPIQEEFQAVMFRATGLSPGSHTLRVEVTGLKNAASQANRIFVDAFDVIQ